MSRSFFATNNTDALKSDSSGRRVSIVGFFIFFVALTVGGRLYLVQVRDHQKWTALARDQRFASVDVKPARAEIFMKDGDQLYPLAVNRQYHLAYAVPKEIDDPASVARSVALALGLDEGTLREKFSQPGDPFEILKHRLGDDDINRVQDLHLPGIHFLPEQYRYYPAGNLASQVVGFASVKDDRVGEVGQYGVEASLDGPLRGTNGTVAQERDAAGRWIALSDKTQTDGIDGKQVVLTLDHVMQYEVEKILQASLEKHDADRVSAMVMDPSTGRILAMATSPSFDPNHYADETDESHFMNPVVSLPYEPGSIMKPITIAMGIEEGKISPNTEYVDTGSVAVPGRPPIRNSQDKVYGRSTMMKVLDQSINTGAIFVENLVGNDRFREYLERFGFGSKTGVELPAELAGNLKNLGNTQPRYTGEFYTASFGQGVTATPLQMLSAYAALANGGLLMRPHIVEKYIGSDGTEEEVKPELIRQVVSGETAKTVGTMLRDVVVNGHGKLANVPGYLVVGKTGTAQVANVDGTKGYSNGLTIGSFVGYAPLDHPRFVVLAKVDNPKDVQWAESSAAPVFGSVMKFLLEYAKVQPTEPIK